MTRTEYDDLIRQRDEIRDKLEQFGIEIEQILDAMGIHNDGECKVTEINGDTATVRYLEPGCHSSCCGKSYETKDIPASWLFGVDWRTELQRQKDQVAQLLAEQKAQKAEQERLERETRDAEEYERLKKKYEATS